MKTCRLLSGSLAALVAVLAVACGSDPDETKFPEGSSGGPNGGSSGGFGSSGGASSGASGGEAQCAATVAETARGKVDIVFVIDNSGSMTEEMNQIRQNVNTFAQKIGGIGIDYRVVFLVRKATAPTQTGNVICVPAPLAGANCADNAPSFFHVDQSVASNNSLALILQTYETAWKQHLRMEATKVFVEVTDDESSLSSDEFDQELLAKQPAGMFGTAQKRNYVFHSIVSMPFGAKPPTTQRCGTSDGTSVVYQELSLLTGGLIDEVCKTDYSSVLDNIAKGIVDRVGCELGYPTGDGADPDKIVVRLALQGQTARDLVQVTDASKCATVKDGWYYDDPAKPTKIILCSSTCTEANAATNAKLEALVGCKAPVPR